MWGSGKPQREFLHVDYCAQACVFLLENYDEEEIINIGVGSDITILQLVELLQSAIGYEGEFEFDASKPDGTPRKLVDVTKINALGWRAKIDLKDGIAATYRWFCEALEGGHLRL